MALKAGKSGINSEVKFFLRLFRSFCKSLDHDEPEVPWNIDVIQVVHKLKSVTI